MPIQNKIMNAEEYRASECRYCGEGLSAPFLDLGLQPLANNLVKTPDEEEFKSPLALCLCGNCGLTQLSHVAPPDLMFKHYLYVSSTTETFRSHFAAYAKQVREIVKMDKGVALDIGSNDGLLVKCYGNEGFNSIGIDPAENLAEKANAEGIETINGYFDADTVRQVIERKGKADVISANNVFAHIGDIASVMGNVTSLLSDKGVFVIEFPYYKIMQDDLVFDMIYHEHVSYINVEPLNFLMKKYGMEIFDIKEVSSHGGSLRVYSSWSNGCYELTDAASRFIFKESNDKYNSMQKAEEFAKKVSNVKDKLWEFIYKAKAEGKVVAGYGAPAKASTIINYCSFGPEDIKYIVDDNPLKQNLLVPGAHIPIYSSAFLKEQTPDVLIVFAWNFAREIIKNNKALLDKGVEFIIPIPDPVIIGNE